MLSLVFWDWLSGNESGSTTIRNIGLVIAGSVALPLAVWRGVVADKQASAALQQASSTRRQAGSAQRQAASAQRGLLNERYQKGAGMLGSDVLSVRLGGIYALQRLAEEHPTEYHLQIMRLMCTFVRYPTEDQSFLDKQSTDEPTPLIRPDIDAAMAAFVNRDEQRLDIESEAHFTVDLQTAKLRGAHYAHANLSRARLHRADMSKAELPNANMSGSDLTCANLSEANLSRADLSYADLDDAELPNATLIRTVMTGATLTGANLADADLGLADLTDAELQDARLPRAGLVDANLSRARLIGTDLSGSRLIGTNLSCARFIGTDLTGANLAHANLSGASLRGAELSGAYFYDPGGGTAASPVTGLTQAQLDAARADPTNPPKLDGVLDAETGKPLIWRGGTVESP